MKTEIMLKLERIAKIGTVEQRQNATSLLDAMNLGVDNMEDAKKFVKKFEKAMEKSENMSNKYAKLSSMLDKYIESFKSESTCKKPLRKPRHIKEELENPMVVADIQNNVVNDAIDVLKVDVPLMLRLLEWSREDATQDADLHVLTENMVSMMKNSEFLTMAEYDAIIPKAEVDVVVDDIIDDIEFIGESVDVRKELERIRAEIDAERDISYDELIFLQDHHKEIKEMGDSRLAEFAGIPEDEFFAETKINENRYATEQDMYDGTISDEEYLDTFEYIYSSLVNGNISQYKKQLARLLKEGDLKAYKNWAEENGLNPRIIDFLESKRVRRGKSINEKVSENTNKKGAYINRAEGKYAVHVSKNGGAIKYVNSLDSAYKFLKDKFNIDKKDVEYIKESKINGVCEEFKDEMSMLTQIQDTDFPQALADTVETDENGELITLEKILNQIEWVKDEITSEIEDVKKEITDVKIDIKATEKASQIEKPVEEVEVIEPIEEVPTEDVKEEPIEEPAEKEDGKKEPIEDKEDEEKLEESFNGRDLKTVWAEDMKMQPIMEFPNGHVVYLEPDYDRNVIVYGGMTNSGIIPEGEVEFDNTKSLDWHIQGIYDELINDNLEESYKKYVKKGYLEDLAQTKRDIDNQVRQGKSAKEIKDTITIKSDNAKEEEEAENYAIDKLKESLLNTKYNAQIQITKK